MPQIPENLMPGTYEVPTIARKQNDVGSYSMASGSLKKIAKIKVNKYGQRFLYPQFQNMWLMGLNGHLQKLQYHDTVGAAELKEAKIIDYYKDSLKYLLEIIKQLKKYMLQLMPWAMEVNIFD